MSSQRGSAVTNAAESSAQASRSGSPAVSATGTHADEVDGGDVSMADAIGAEDSIADIGAGLPRDVNSRSGSAASSSYIQRVPQLDIAFLHAISTHRPLGPHKHFNLIPILITLDRTARQIGAGIRDNSAGLGGESDEEEERSRSSSRPKVKREEGEEEHNATHAVNIDSDMVWQRLDELYDVEGLEDLEDQAVQADDSCPFNNKPKPTFVSLTSRNVLGGRVAGPAAFGFGSSLEKIPVAPSASTKSAGRKRSKSKAAAADDDEEEEDRTVDFELGPWEEYEDLIAQRRKKTYAPDEDQPSESDGELSEAEEEAVKAESDAGTAGVDGDQGDGGGQEANQDDADEDEEEDEDEDEDEEGDEDGKRPSKRKGSGPSRKTAAATRQKRSGGSMSSPAAATRSSRNAVKPRRSGRR